MSNPPGSQPTFAGGLPRAPPMMISPLAPFGPGGLPPPPGSMGPGFPPRPVLRPAPRPQVHPASSSPVVLNPPGGPRPPPVTMALPPKHTTVYVGKIAPSIKDDLIRQLLEACGPITSWKRMEDPDTKEPKAFGFCEYEEADGVIRALNLLGGLSVGGQELLLKCNSVSQTYVDEYKARKSRAAQEAAHTMDVDGEENAADSADRVAAEADNQALEKIMALVSAHAPKVAQDAAAAADSFLSSLKEESERRSRHEKQSSRDRSRSGRRDGRVEDDKALEASFHRERDRERKEVEARLQEQDNVYKTALRKWEAQESDRRKYIEREKEHERDIAKERDRQLRADMEGSASDDEEEPWRQKLYAGSRRAADRKRRREKEEHDDELNKTQEAEELAKRAKSSEKEANPSENGYASSSPSLPAVAANPRLEDPNDSITQAMMNAAKAPRKSPASTHSTAAQLSPLAQPLPGIPKREAAPQPKAPAKRKAVLAAFGGDEEDEQPKRTLKPITYTEEEQKAAQRKSPQEGHEHLSVKELIAMVPKDSKAVLSYDINWRAYDEGGPALKDKITKWVSKKTAELLGEEEASMVEFIMGQLQEHVAAESLLEELQAVLDDEANPFVFKLYRTLIFETLKQAANLQD